MVVSNDAVMTETLKRTDVQLYAVMLQDVEIGFFLLFKFLNPDWFQI